MRDVLARTRAHPRRTAPRHAWHCTLKPTPPLPRTLELTRDPIEPETDRAPTEPDRLATEPASHRRR
jgi:hypothetical protein